MDGCSRQNPAYRFAKEKPRFGGAFLVGRRPAAGCRLQICAGPCRLVPPACRLEPLGRVKRVSASPDSFNARATLAVGERSYDIFRLDALQSEYDVARL